MQRPACMTAQHCNSLQQATRHQLNTATENAFAAVIQTVTATLQRERSCYCREPIQNPRP